MQGAEYMAGERKGEAGGIERAIREATTGDPPDRDCLPGSNDKWAGYHQGVEEAIDAAVEHHRRPVDALREIYSYAYGASGVTGDDAGHLTHVGMLAKAALEAAEER